jgi:hypothetical protein
MTVTIFSPVGQRAIMLAAARSAVRIMLKALMLWLCAAILLPSRWRPVAKMTDGRADDPRGG